MRRSSDLGRDEVLELTSDKRGLHDGGWGLKSVCGLELVVSDGAGVVGRHVGNASQTITDQRDNATSAIYRNNRVKNDGKQRAACLLRD